MAAAVGLRDDFTAAALRRLAQTRREAGQVRWLLALAVIYDGGSRSEAARIGGVGLQTVRDWVLRFNHHGPDGLIDGKAPGGRPRLDASQRAALAAAVERSPCFCVLGTQFSILGTPCCIPGSLLGIPTPFWIPRIPC